VTVVLDTNVLVAALVAEGLCREVVHRVIRMRGVATSRPLLDELDTTVPDPTS
jgi:predicted nucleic acid-binding protein